MHILYFSSSNNASRALKREYADFMAGLVSGPLVLFYFRADCFTICWRVRCRLIDCNQANNVPYFCWKQSHFYLVNLELELTTVFSSFFRFGWGLWCSGRCWSSDGKNWAKVSGLWCSSCSRGRRGDFGVPCWDAMLLSLTFCVVWQNLFLHTDNYMLLLSLCLQENLLKIHVICEKNFKYGKESCEETKSKQMLDLNQQSLSVKSQS